MSTKIGTPLAPRTVAWVWFAFAADVSVVSGWWAARGETGWTLSTVFAGAALLIYLEPKLRKRELETVQIDDVGVLRAEASIRGSPVGGNRGDQNHHDQHGTIYRRHAAAVRTKLLEALQARFPIADAAVIAAMGSTSNNTFLLWKRRVPTPDSAAPGG
jgi:hypothetical protein